MKNRKGGIKELSENMRKKRNEMLARMMEVEEEKRKVELQRLKLLKQEDMVGEYEEEDITDITYTPTYNPRMERGRVWYNDKGETEQGELSMEEWRNGCGELHQVDDKPAFISYMVNNKVMIMEWYKNGVLHRNDNSGYSSKRNLFEKPARIEYTHNMNVVKMEWYFEGRLHRHSDTGPALIHYFTDKRNKFIDGNIRKVGWYSDGKAHRYDKAAIIEYDKNDNVIKEEWNIHGRYSRDDDNEKPCLFEYKNEVIIHVVWYQEGLIHSPVKKDSSLYPDGSTSCSFISIKDKDERYERYPAEIKYIIVNGNSKLVQVKEEKWYVKGLLSRSNNKNDQPSLITYFDTGAIEREEWYFEGNRHREGDKPALIHYHPNGTIKLSKMFIHGSAI